MLRRLRWLVRGRLFVGSVCVSLLVALGALGGLVLPVNGVANPTCTDTFTGGASTEIWTTAGNWSSGVPGSSDVVCIGSGVTVRVTEGTNSAASVQDEGTLVVSGGSLALTDESGVSPVDSLSLTGGTLSLSGEIDVASSLASSGNATVSGSGYLVVQSGATGTVGTSSCSLLTLSGVTFRNEGTVTVGASGGVSGQLDMAEGAHLQNTGTFNADSYPAGCVPGANIAAIQYNSGSPSITNTGTFNADAGSHSALVSVPFNNEGTVHVTSGGFNPTGGGTSTEGTWETASGTEVAFTAGSYTLTHDDASAAKLTVNGGTLTVATGISTVGSLSLAGGTLSLTGVLDVAGSLTSSANTTASGIGSLVVQSGATASLGASGCSLLTLSGVTLLNEGTVTLGASGGVSGQLDMAEGAHLENTGTFNVDSYPAGCVAGANIASIQSNSGGPSITNAGTFNADAGSGHTASVSVPLTNEGTVHVASGTFNPTGGGTSTEGVWTTAGGTEVAFTTGSYTLTHDNASAAKVAVSGGTLTIATGTTSVDSLSLTGGTLSLTGQLDVATSLTSSGNATINGAGSLVVQSGATGSLGASGCALLTLSGATLLNEGTVTLGASGGVSGQLDMAEGAHIENEGTFNADSYPAGCVAGANIASIQYNSGSPSMSNTGAFNSDVGSGHTVTVSVPFSNNGTVNAQTGSLQFTGGGMPEQVAVGSWSKESGTSLVLGAGTFLIGEEVDLSQVEVTGATVERVATEGPPGGSLSSLPFASATVELAGTGHSTGGGFASAAIEVTPTGTSEWVELCGPLTPGLTGAFDCTWNTLSGSYPDGHYQLRALLTNTTTPPVSAHTPSINTIVDNTTPTGTLTTPTYIGTASTVAGTGDDSGSGVASWQLQITPAGTSEWASACSQSTPTSGDHYSCTASTSGLTGGSYELRAIITDHAANTHTTSAGSTTLDNTAPSGTLASVSESEYVKGTLSLEGTASDSGAGVASWTAQIAPAGTSSWTNACSPQTTPISGSTYGCSLNTTGHTDGAYQLRALITDNAGNTHTTTAQEKTIDNTPPAGSLNALGHHSSGVIEVTGSAIDAVSGVASWQLEVKPTSGGSWESACLTQNVPLEGSTYGCSVDTTLLTDGSYQFRATLTDNAGNTYATPLRSTHINNSGEEEGAPECTDTWTGGASTEAWATAGNWSAGVPGSTDVACIGSGETVRVTEGTQTVASVQAEGTLVISGGSLEVSDESTVSTVDSLSLTGGTLSLTGDLDVASSLTSSGNATVNGAGRLVIKTGATGSLGASGCALLTLSGVTMRNEGTVTLGASGGVSGQLDMAEGAHIENTGTFNADSYASGCVPGANSAAIQYNSGGPTMTNTGTLNVDVGSHTATVSVPLTNEGTIHVASGTFNPTGGGTSTESTWTTASGTEVTFTAGNYTLTHDDASGGKLAVNGGTLNIATGTSTVGTLSLTGGTLSLTGELDVSGSLTSSGNATVSGTGNLVVQPGATASLGASGCALLTLSGVTMRNEGTVTLGASGGVSGQLDMAEGAHLENTGTFNADSYASGCVPGANSAAIQYNSGGPTMTNTGTLNVNVGSGHTTTVSVPLTNEGTIHVASGMFNPTGGGTSTEGTWTTASGTEVTFTAGSYTLTHDDASEAKLAVNGGTLTIATGTSTVGTLSLTGGTLSLTGELDVSGSLTSSGNATVSGTGSLVVQSGATASLGASGCALLTLSGVTFRNEGTVTLGASGGVSGQLDMAEGAHLENTGTFNADSYASGCVPGSNSAAIQYNSGGPTMTNTGTLNVDIGSGHTATVSVLFNNDGIIEAHTGHLVFSGGGIPTAVATGSWSADEGALITLSSGEFLIGTSVDLSQVEVTGATVTREEGSGAPHGSLTPHTYAHGSFTIAGTGESVGSGFSAATIEVTPASESAWHSLCGPLTPTSGAFGCSWNTTGGSYPDGSYHLRAQLSDSSTPANTAPTSTITVLVDNTAPTGALEAPSSPLSGSALITGTAGDSGSGVATWQLQITPAGTSEWANACPSQSTPVTEGVYGCSLETTEYEDGNYQLRTVTTDNAGNTHTTTAVEAEIHNEETPVAPSNTSPPTISGQTKTGHTLTGSVGSWSGSATISYTYQWQRCNESGGECGDISGQTSSTYILGEGDIGTTLKVVVGASNSAGSASATSSASAVVVEGFQNTALPSITGTAQDGQMLTANNGEWSAGGLTYTYQWESCDIHGEHCNPLAGATGQTYRLDSGDIETTLRVLVTAANSTGSESVTSAAMTEVEPGEPVELEAPIITGTPNIGQKLYADHGVWAGTDVNTTIQWQRCNTSGASCTEITGATEDEYELTESDLGHKLRVSVQATNELGSVTDTSTATAVIGGALTLVNSSPPTVTGTPQSGNTLTAEHGSWSGEGTVTYTDQWQECDQFAGNCQDITSATGATYTLGSEDANTTIRVIVTASDSNGSQAVPSAVTQPIASAAAPVVGVAPTITGTDQEGHTLTVHNGEWSGEGTITYSYQWETCADEGRTCSDIPGATSSTYLLTMNDVESTVRVIVTATDGGGSTTGMSAPTEPITAATLFNTAIPTISGSQWSGQTLSAEPGMWEASSSIEYAYQWMRCDSSAQSCTAISGATASTYELGEGDVGSIIEVDVTATGTWGEATVPSDPTGVIAPVPTAPLNDSRPSIAQYANEGDTLTAEAGSWSGTEPMTFTYQWQYCAEECTDIPGATSGTYVLGGEDVGKYVQVVVTATNVSGSASENSYTTERVGNNSAPEATTTPYLYGSTQDQQVLVLEQAEWSGAQPIEHQYQWERCNSEGTGCTDISGATGTVYGVVSADIGSTLRVKESVSNQHGSSYATTEATAVVTANPASGSVPTIGGDAYLGDTLTASVNSVTGTSPVETAYQWQRCNTEGASCTDISAATSSTYSLAEADVGSTIKVLAIYTNAYGADEETSTPTAMVQDTAPAYVSGIHITRSTEDFTVPGVILTGHTGIWHGTAPIEYAYQWERCSTGGGSCTNISGAISSTYTITESDEEHSVSLIVTATNTRGSASEHAAGYNVRVPQGPWETNPEVTGTPREGETLTAHSYFIWNPTSITYQWQRCNPQWYFGFGGSQCTNISGATSQTYTLTADDDGFRIKVWVTGSNAYGSDSLDSFWTGIVQALPPVNTSLPTISGEGIVGSPLDAEPGTWTGTTSSLFGGSPWYEFQWQLCDAEGHGCHNIAGATGGVYTPPSEDLGLTVRVIVTALSAESWTPSSRASATATSAVTAPLGAATAATNTSAPTLSGTAEDGETLAVAHGTWTGSPTIEYSYQWRRCNSEGASCTDIEGAVEATYKAEEPDIAHTLRAVVTATNGAGPVSATTSPSEAIAGPEAPSNVIPPSFRPFEEQRVAEKQFIEPGTWTGNPAIAFQWQRCDTTQTDPETEGPVCTNITGATHNWYKPVTADVGYELNLVETATNPAGSATARSGPNSHLVEPFSIGASGGAITGALVSGQTITADSTVRPTPTLPVTTTYEFVRMNSSHTVLQEGSSASYTLTSADVGYEIKVVMVSTVWRADEAIAVGSRTVTYYTSPVEVAPANDTAPSITGETVQGAPLSANHGEWHGGGGTLTYAYQWQRCDSAGASCADISAASEATYLSTTADIGHTIRVVVTAANQGATGTATSTHTATITPATALANTSPPTIAGEPIDQQTLTADPGEWSGSAPINYTYQWEACDPEGEHCTALQGATTAAYHLDIANLNTTLRVDVTASNAAGAGTATSSTTSVVAAAGAPAIQALPSLTLLGLPEPGATLSTDGGHWTGIDRVRHPDELEYRWERCQPNGEACEQVAETGSPTYVLGPDDIGSRLRVTVSAHNETGRASAASQLTATILSAHDEEESEEEEETTSLAGEKMVYVRGSGVYSANLDGSNVHELASCSQLDPSIGEACVLSHPRISPTGEMVAVEVRATSEIPGCESNRLCIPHDAASYGHVGLVNYDGSQPHLLLPGTASQPTWSPDGTSLIVSAGSHLYSIQADGSNATDPTPFAIEGAEASQSLSYSTDGTQMTFIGHTSTGSASSVYTATSNGRRAQALPLGTLENVNNPVFTPDGTQIVFTATHPAPEGEPWFAADGEVRHLYAINTDGSSLHEITVEGGGPGNYDYSPPSPGPSGTTIITSRRPVFYETDGYGYALRAGDFNAWSMGADGSGGTSHASHIGDITYGILGHNRHTPLITGSAPDGWCNGHLHGVGEASRRPNYYGQVYETSGEARGFHLYTIGLEVEKNFDCEGGTSHIYWVPYYDTRDLGGTNILMAPGAERYDATGSRGRITEVRHGERGPYRGALPSVEYMLRHGPKFRVRAARATATDPRIWRFFTGIAPEDTGNAYDLLIHAVTGVVNAIEGGPHFTGIKTSQHYIRWLPPGCYPSAGSEASAASCH